jgi:hypothetical protein
VDGHGRPPLNGRDAVDAAAGVLGRTLRRRRGGQADRETVIQDDGGAPVGSGSFLPPWEPEAKPSAGLLPTVRATMMDLRRPRLGRRRGASVAVAQ